MFDTRMTCGLLCVLIGLICGQPQRLAAQAHWTSRGWSYSRTCEAEAKSEYATRPDEQTLQTITVAWQEPELDGLANICTIDGRLEIPGDGQRQPVNWFQGITVYMGKAPGAQPDWSAGMTEDALRNTGVVSPAGTFSSRFDLRKTQHDRTRLQSFQFGLALARHTKTAGGGDEVLWNSQLPAVPATVQMLDVPAAAELSHELELINRASGWPLFKQNSVPLIQAVNALQRLGKERVLAILEEYVDLTVHLDYRYDQEIVFWIIRVLFEPIRLDDRIPDPLIAVHLTDRDSAELANWPLSPMAVVDDIPFMLGRMMDMGGGLSGHPWAHIVWARRHGVIRDEPLRPRTNPIHAAEALLRSQRFKQLDRNPRESAIESVRTQAMSMVEGLARPMVTQYFADDAERAEANRQWQIRVEEADLRAIRWDTQREEFADKGT